MSAIDPDLHISLLGPVRARRGEADVALFAQLHQLDHLEPLQLTTNFRSRPAVLRWINTWFRSWFDADPGQVPFAPLDHHVPESPATVAVVGRATDASAEQVARDQARDIARVIGLAHDSWLVRHDGAVNLGWLMLGFALSAATAQALLHRHARQAPARP